ncbi:MAG TPA: energy-coupling factor transporter transmembrane component T [Desulfitobacteriaceae bacterium]|nr:energy-coupling factor transporter transmembrane component T [Desulfitobacteriaceae bacterium]
MKPLFQTGISQKGLIHIDPRTKLLILLIGNISVFLMPSLKYEVMIALAIMIFGILCGVARFSLKMTVAYFILIIIQVAGTDYLPDVLKFIIVTFAIYIRKLFPCVMLGGILITTTRVSEFMAAMNRLCIPKSVVIPLAVMLRYFPMISEEWGYIKDAMRMRDVSFSLWGLIKNPGQTMECVYVPLMMSASKIADELSAASVTRGIENPKPRTCLQQIRFRWVDAACTACFTAFLFAAFIV